MENTLKQATITLYAVHVSVVLQKRGLSKKLVKIMEK
jgi:hypothetical protein